MKLNSIFLTLTLLLFMIECYIGFYLKDAFIRPFVGDFLVVILIYCFIKIFFEVKPIILGLSVLMFSYFVEILQLFKISDKLGLQKGSIAAILVGNSFSWGDILAYTLGLALIVLIEEKG